MASNASAALEQMITPFPAASPSALTTIDAAPPDTAYEISRRFELGEYAEARRRHSALFEQALGERLAALEPRACGIGPEGAKPSPLESVDEAESERQLGSDHRQVDRVLRGESTDPLDVVPRRGARSASSAMPALPGAQ